MIDFLFRWQNALDLTAPASDVLLKNRRSSWVQLSGHPGSFAPAGLGTLWKKQQGSDNNEQLVYEALMKDPAADIVPKYYRDVTYQGESKFFFPKSFSPFHVKCLPFCRFLS